MIAWLKRWGWVLAFAAGAIVVFILTAGRVRPNVKAVVAGAKAEAEATKLVSRIGRDEAKKLIEKQHEETIANLDEKERVQAAKLRDDPAARARFYARVAARKRRR